MVEKQDMERDGEGRGIGGKLVWGERKMVMGLRNGRGTRYGIRNGREEK